MSSTNGSICEIRIKYKVFNIQSIDPFLFAAAGGGGGLGCISKVSKNVTRF